MFNIEEWISDFSQKIQENFKSRIEFIGLQGSYAREEATEGSDIDVVVIFDKLKMDDLKKYDEIISKMSCREKSAAFYPGKMNWLIGKNQICFNFIMIQKLYTESLISFCR